MIMPFPGNAPPYSKEKKSNLRRKMALLCVYRLTTVITKKKNLFLVSLKLKALADDKYDMTRNLSFMWQKTLWEKQKMLVTSIFSLTHNFFK